VGQVPASLWRGKTPSIWVHAVSVGEVVTVRPLLDALRLVYPTHRLLLSTTTATGQKVAHQLGDVVDGVFYAPLDLPRFVRRSLASVSPELMIFVDTEIWPNWLRACRRRGVKTVIVNGRISDRSYRGYRRGRPFMRRVLRDVDRVCAQTNRWGQRFVNLGLPAERLAVTGSLKFDASDGAKASETDPGDGLLTRFAFARDRMVVMAASTLSGEDEPVLRAFEEVRKTDSRAVLVLAPRHPERASTVMASANACGFTTVARTALETHAESSVDVIVLDTVGELARLFQLASIVFVGGSLVPAGGHNILEPAVYRKPIVFGPHMQNFAETADIFVRHGAAVQVHSAQELEQVLVALTRDPARCATLGAAAYAVVEANRGAGIRTLDVIRVLLPPNSSPRRDDVRPEPTARGRT
jgi:3-deoxy-D-manno-octulosonic-acid transferase